MPNLEQTIAQMEAEKDLTARKFTDTTRKKLAKKGVAEKDGSFPIANVKDLANAKRDLGRAGNKPSDRAHINKRAKALGLPGLNAGGPGSGRHPSEVKLWKSSNSGTAEAKAHNYLSEKGFKYSKSQVRLRRLAKSSRNYTHPVTRQTAMIMKTGYNTPMATTKVHTIIHD